jgi:hypothetical protein
MGIGDWGTQTEEKYLYVVMDGHPIEIQRRRRPTNRLPSPTDIWLSLPITDPIDLSAERRIDRGKKNMELNKCDASSCMREKNNHFPI